MDSRDLRIDTYRNGNPSDPRNIHATATHLPTGTTATSTEGNTLYENIERAKAEVVRQLRATDPRLASLPEDLRAVACEFLELHGAWGTEFEASVWLKDCLAITWVRKREDKEMLSAARVEWYREEAWRSGGEAWSLLGREFEPGRFHEVEGLRINYFGRLRRSADFAEFVQRFKREVVSG